jgi:hypothetical protein
VEWASSIGPDGRIRDTKLWEDDVDLYDMAESVGYTCARWVIFHRGQLDWLGEERAFACRAFREKLLSDASRRMAVDVLAAPKLMRLLDQGYFNLLALHLLEVRAAARA